MNHAFLIGLLLFASSAVILPLLTVGAVRLFEKKICRRACYLIFVVCAIRVLLPVGLGLPSLIDLADVIPSRTRNDVIIRAEEEDVSSALNGSGLVAQTQGADSLGSSGNTVSEDKTSFSSFWNGLSLFLTRYGTLLLLAVWGSGAVIFLCLSVIPQMRWMRWERKHAAKTDSATEGIYRAVCAELGLRHPPKLSRLDCAVVPHLSGVFHPRVVIGNTLFNERELTYVLRHELTHYRRGDIFVKWLLLLDVAVFWWNPAVRLLVRYTQETMELSCDERVLLGLEDETRHEYCSAILKVLKENAQARSVLSVGFSSDRFRTVERFREILNVSPKKRGVAVIVIATVVLLCSGAVLGCSAFAQDVTPVTETFFFMTPCNLTQEQLVEISKSLEVPQAEGMNMIGWNVYSETNEDGGYSIRFEAAFEPRAYGLTFVANGGEVSEVKEGYSYGESLPDATRAGYTFDGWYYDIALRERADKVPAKSCRLYAKWAEESASGDFTFTQRNGTLSVSAYRGNDTDIHIPAYVGGMAVTGIDINCFAFKTELRSVVLPETVISVGAGAFRYCYALERVECLSAALPTLDRSVFEACYRLRELTVGGEKRAFEIP